MNSQGDLGSLGVRGGDIEGFEPTDLDDGADDADSGDLDVDTDSPISGAEGGSEDEI